MDGRSILQVNVGGSFVVLDGTALHAIGSGDNTVFMSTDDKRTVKKDIGLPDRYNDGSYPIEIRNYVPALGNGQQVIFNCQSDIHNIYETSAGAGYRVDTLDLNSNESREIYIRNEKTGESIQIKIQAIMEESEESDEEDIAERAIRTASIISDTDISTDGLKSMLDKSASTTKLGQGRFRRAYKVDVSNFDALQENDGGIIKLARDDRGRNANRKEMETWQAVRSTKHADLFCPVTSIGNDGRYLIMREADKVGTYGRKAEGQMEEKLLNILNTEPDEYELDQFLDIHSDNLGMYDGQVVMIDYPFGANFEINNPMEDVNMLKKYFNKLYDKI